MLLSLSDFDTAEVKEFDLEDVCIPSIVNLVDFNDGDISCKDKWDDIIESSEDSSDVLGTAPEPYPTAFAVKVEMTSFESELDGSEAIMAPVKICPRTISVVVSNMFIEVSKGEVYKVVSGEIDVILDEYVSNDKL